MKPTDLAEYLKAIRDSGALQCHVECNGPLDPADLTAPGAHLKLSVVFPASVPEMPKDFSVPEPGGWKSMTGDLDAPLEPEL